MKKMLKMAKAAVAGALTFIIAAGAAACSSPLDEKVTPVAKADFRVTAYMVGDRFLNPADIDDSHFDQVTDFIFMGMADFNTAGEIVLSEDFETAYNNIVPYLPADANFYINLLGPKSTLQTEDWNAQMEEQGKLHTQAFQSGVLEQNIKDLLDTYGFDGVYFDYEYPINQENWDAFNAFIISLDSCLGEDYKIGMAMSDWDLGQSEEAMAATDFIEIMAYDNWDKNGNHAPYENAEKSIEALLKKDMSALNSRWGFRFTPAPQRRRHIGMIINPIVTVLMKTAFLWIRRIQALPFHSIHMI